MGRLHVTLISLLLASFALTGCFGDDGTDDPDQTDGDDHDDHDDHDDGNQTDDGDQADENATVDRTLTFEGSIESGDVPLVVNFTINSTDLDNVTSWIVDFEVPVDGATADGNGTDDGNGTAGNGTTQEEDYEGPSDSGATLPANTTHTYEVEGNYSAVLTVEYSDGGVETADLLVVVQAPASGDGGDAPQDIIMDIEGTMTISLPGSGWGSGPVGENEWCDLDDYARDNDLNNTSVTYFDLQVQEGVTRVYIEGGADEVADVGGVTALPDFDVVIQGPEGTCVTGGSEGSYERISIKDGAGGTYTAMIVYWAGPPMQDYFGQIQVNYGSFIE